MFRARRHAIFGFVPTEGVESRRRLSARGRRRVPISPARRHSRPRAPGTSWRRHELMPPRRPRPSRPQRRPEACPACGDGAAGGCELAFLQSKPCASTACTSARGWASAARGCRGRRPHRRTARGGGRGRARQEGLGAREPRWRRRAWVSQRLARCTPSKFLGQPGIGIWLIGINSGYARSSSGSP